MNAVRRAVAGESLYIVKRNVFGLTDKVRKALGIIYRYALNRNIIRIDDLNAVIYRQIFLYSCRVNYSVTL